MNIKLSYIVIGCLVILLLLSNLFHKPTIVTKTEYKTDTTYIVKIDTSKIIKPYLIEIKKLKDVSAYNVKIIDKLKYSKAQVDTIYRDSIIYLPKTQKHYFEKNKYEAWISGYNPVLDSINVFNRIEYKTITNTVKETIYKEKWNWYLETGINSIDSKIAPYVGIRLTMPNSFGIGGNIGVFDNKAFYGFSINYKIK